MHRVYLVPGFFGFANLGDLRYFGHVHTFLSARFAEDGIDASVHEVATRPTASLKERTTTLFQAIDASSTEHDTVHLIGHSSGGIDCRLLVSPGVDLGVEADPVAQRVRNIVTVATPHRGTPSAAAFTTMAGKRLLRLLSLLTMVVIRRGTIPITILVEIARLLKRFEIDGEDGIVDEVFTGLLNELDAERRDAITRFFGDVRADQALLPQITPDAMDAFNVGAVDRPGVRYGAVITRARRPGLRGVLEAGASPYAQASNALYIATHRLAAASPPQLLPHVASLASYWSDLEASDNDGMVPTASQSWGETVATVDADHLDVIGHFSGPDQTPPHYDWIRTGTGYRRPAFEATWAAVYGFLMAPTD